MESGTFQNQRSSVYEKNSILGLAMYMGMFAIDIGIAGFSGTYP
jgi:hypothetical protein